MDSPCIISWTRLTASGVISLAACLFYGLNVVSDDSTKVSVNIYNGVSTSDPKVLKYWSEGKVGTPFMLPYPIKLDRGLYADLDSDCDEATIFWQPLKD